MQTTFWLEAGHRLIRCLGTSFSINARDASPARFRGMKTTPAFHRLNRVQVWAGWLVVLCVVSLEFWMLWRFGTDCLQAMTRHDRNMPGVEVQLAFQ
jgi:hypothetical protein